MTCFECYVVVFNEYFYQQLVSLERYYARLNP